MFVNNPQYKYKHVHPYSFVFSISQSCYIFLWQLTYRQYFWVLQFTSPIPLTLKVPNKNCSRRHFISYFYLLKKIRPNFSCESSAQQRIHLKHQVLFSLKNNEKIFIVIGTLRVKCLNIRTTKIINFPFLPNGKLMDLGVPVFKHNREYTILETKLPCNWHTGIIVAFSQFWWNICSFFFYLFGFLEKSEGCFLGRVLMRRNTAVYSLPLFISYELITSYAPCQLCHFHVHMLHADNVVKQNLTPQILSW